MKSSPCTGNPDLHHGMFHILARRVPYSAFFNCHTTPCSSSPPIGRSTQMSSSSDAWQNVTDRPWRLHNLLLRLLHSVAAKLNTSLTQHNAVLAKQSVPVAHAISMARSLDLTRFACTRLTQLLGATEFAHTLQTFACSHVLSLDTSCTSSRSSSSPLRSPLGSVALTNMPSQHVHQFASDGQRCNPALRHAHFWVFFLHIHVTRLPCPKLS